MGRMPPKVTPLGTRFLPQTRSMGRPATLSGHVVAVSIDGRGAAWCDGVFQGDPDIVKEANASILFETHVEFRGMSLRAHGLDALGALGALASYAPGRAIVVEAPPRVRAILDAIDTDDNPFDWSL